MIAQEVIPSRGFDLRVLVADGTVVGAIERHSRPGEWRTNVSMGANARTVLPPKTACALARAAARAVEADLVGVDLMPLPNGGYVVIELNGAADFDHEYVFGDDIYMKVAEALRLGVAHPTAV